jgi:lysophospholipase
VFFGCEAKADEPLVIYIANGAPPPGQPAITNFSSFDFDFTPDQAQAIMGQGFTFATQGIANGTVVRDEDWPACLACAVTDRARDRSGAAREGVCASCFERYCWGAQGAVAEKGTANSGPAGRSLTLTMTVVMLVLSTIWVFI